MKKIEPIGGGATPPPPLNPPLSEQHPNQNCIGHSLTIVIHSPFYDMNIRRTMADKNSRTNIGTLVKPNCLSGQTLLISNSAVKLMKIK